jgi:hypothetical protein
VASFLFRQDEEKVQTDSLSRKPFVVNSRIRAKTEDIFFDPEYRFPGMGPGTGLRKLENMVRLLPVPFPRQCVGCCACVF